MYGSFADLQAKTSRGCRFLLFWHYSYEVTLSVRGILSQEIYTSPVPAIRPAQSIIQSKVGANAEAKNPPRCEKR